MLVSVKIQATCERMVIEFMDRDYRVDIPNVILYSSVVGELIAVGKEKSELEPGLNDDNPTRPRFGKSFCYSDDAASTCDIDVLKHFIDQFYTEKSRLGLNLFDWFDYEMTIQGYDQWPEKRKLHFVYSLQTVLRARLIKINGVSVEIVSWKRAVEFFLRLIFHQIFPYLLFMFGAIWMSLGMVILAALCHYGSVILWFLIVEKLIARTYSLHLFGKFAQRPYLALARKILLRAGDELEYVVPGLGVKE